MVVKRPLIEAGAGAILESHSGAENAKLDNVPHVMRLPNSGKPLFKCSVPGKISVGVYFAVLRKKSLSN